MFASMIILESEKSGNTPAPGPIGEEEQYPNCIPNISTQERKKKTFIWPRHFCC